MGVAPWIVHALAELGQKENPDPHASNARIISYRKIGKCWDGDEDDGEIAWCAIFANAMLELSGIPGTRSPGARSFERSAHFKKLDHFIPGCIVTFWRGSKTSGLGHVGFGLSCDAISVTLINGNARDAVAVSKFAKNSKVLGVSGYFWPMNAAVEGNTDVPSFAATDRGGKVT